MKYSNTAITQLTRLYKSILVKCAIFNAAILMSSAFVAAPAMASAPITNEPVFVFGDVSFANQDVARGEAAFGGRRMDNWAEGKYQNDFPKYQMIGRSFALKDSKAYIGPVTLTLRELTGDDNFKFNYQVHEVDTDLAATAGVVWNDNYETVYSKLAAKINPEDYTPNSENDNAHYTAPAVYAMAQRDNLKSAGDISFNNTNATIDGATVNADSISVTNGSTLTFVKQDSSQLGAFNGGNIDSDGKSVLNADTININGSRMVVNSGAELTVNARNGAAFTGASSTTAGAAIYNEGIVTLAGTNTFSGNTANGVANDIYNTGTLNINGTATLAGGIDGDSANKGTVNVAGDVEVSTIKNQTVAHNSGELHITNGATDGSNLSGSTVTVASDAIINTIDDVVNDYMTGGDGKGTITLQNGASIKGDVNFLEGTADKYAAASGASVKYSVGNLLGSIGKGEKTIQVASNGATVDISQAKFTTENGLKFVSSGTNDGKMIVKGMTGGIEDAADESEKIGTIDYQLTDDESVDTAKSIHDVFVLTGAGVTADSKALTLNADLGVVDGADLTVNNLKLEGDAALTNAERGVLRINDSSVNVAVNNAGTLISDPTTYYDAVTNTGTASFDGDTFASGSSLTNSGTVNLSGAMTFASGSTLTGNAGNVLNIVSGITAFNGTSNGNNVYVANGANFSGALTGGSVNTQNDNIDTITGSVLSSALYMDANLKAGTSDKFGTGSSGTIKSINLTSSEYGDADSKTIDLGSNYTLDSDLAITGAMNYYTDVKMDGTNLVFSDKLVNTSTIRGKLDSSSNPTGNVVLGDRAATTTVGTANAQIALNNANQTAEIKSGAEGNGAHIAIDTKTKKKAELSADETTGGKMYTAGVNANATSKQVEMVADYYADATDLSTLTNTAYVRAGFSGTDSYVDVKGDSINLTSSNGLVVSDGTNNATLTAKTTGLDVAQGLTVGGTSYGINSTGVGKFNGLTVGSTTYGINASGAGTLASLTVGGYEALTTDSALNGAKLTPGTVAKTALASGVQTTLTNADTLYTNLGGVTATAAELNVLNGITASTAELNLLDGMTAVNVDSTAATADKTTLATVSTVKKAIADTDEMSESYNDGSNVYTSSVAVESTATDKKVTLGVDKDGTTLAGITVDGGAATPVVTVTGGLNAYDGVKVSANSGLTADTLTISDGSATSTLTKNALTTATVNATTGVKFGSDANAMTGTTASKINYTNQGATTLATAKSVYDALGRIDGLVTANGDGTYTYNATSGAYTLNYTNLPTGTTVEDVALALNTSIGNRNYVTGGYTGNLLANGDSISTSVLTFANVLGSRQTTAATSGILEGLKIGGNDTDATKNISVIDAINKVATESVGTAANNVFTGENTFRNTNGVTIQNTGGTLSATLKATDDGLEVSKAVKATGFMIGSNSVTSIDISGAAVNNTTAAQNVMATGATVYEGAENAKYNGTKINGDTSSTTIKTALNTTNTKLNGILTTDGSKVLADKVNVAWNSGTVTLDNVLGNGVYTSTNKVALGDSLTTAVSKLDTAVGAAITGQVRSVTGGTTAAANSINANIDALDKAVGGDVTSTNYVAANKSVNANISSLDVQVKANADAIAASTVIGTAATSSAGYASTATVKDAVIAIDGALKNTEDKNGIQDTGMGNLASTMGVTYTAATGAVSATDYAYTNYIADGDSLVTAVGKLDNALKTADANYAKLDGNNVFTGTNEFKAGIKISNGGSNTSILTATADGLNVDTDLVAKGVTVGTDGLTMGSNTVTSIDVNGEGVTSAATAANIMATAATVYSGAENGAYTGTKVKGDTTSTTVKEAMGATAAALNTLTTTAGNEIDSAKVDVQWNSTDSTLSTVLGNGNYASNNYVADGASVTTAIGNLDTALKTTDDTIGARAIGAGTAGTLNGKTIGTATGNISVVDALETLNATNVSQNGSMNTLAGLINGQGVDAATGALTGTATALNKGSGVGQFAATNLTAAANELMSDITVATGTYNYISQGSNVGSNLIALDTQVKNVTDKVAVVGTPEAAAVPDGGILNGKAITGDSSVSGHMTLVEAVRYMSEKAAGLDLNNTFTGNNTFNGTVKIGSANAISSTTDGELNMGNNELTNVAGLTLVNGSADVALNADTSGNLVVDSGVIAKSLGIGTAGTEFTVDTSGNTKTGTLQIGAANAITGTASSLNMGANDLTNIKNLTTTGNATITGTLSAGATTISASGSTSGTPVSALAVTATNTGDDKTTSFNVTSDGVSVVGQTNLQNTKVQGNLVMSNGTTDVTIKTASVTGKLYGDATDTTKDMLTVNNDIFVDGMVSSTHGLGVFSDDDDGTYTQVFDVNDKGSITSDMFKTDNSSSGNTVTIGKDTSTATSVTGTMAVAGATQLDSTLTANGESKFGKDTSGVYSLDVTDSAVTANKEIDANAGVKFGTATGEKVMTSVEQGAVAALNATGNDQKLVSAQSVAATREAINTDANAVLGGVYKVDATAKTVSYDNTAIAGTNGFESGASDLTDALTKFANNVQAAMGTTYAANGTYTNGFAKPAAVDYDGLATDQSLVSAISQLDKNIGTAITGTDRSGTAFDTSATKTVNENIAALDAAIGADVTEVYNGVATTKSINQNIDAINATLGYMDNLSKEAKKAGSDVVTRGNLTNANNTPLTDDLTVADALSNLDKTLGRIHGLYDGTKVNVTDPVAYPSVTGANSNLAKGTTVENHLVSLDNAIGSRNIASLNADINKAVNGDATATDAEARHGSLALGLQSVGDQMGDMDFTSTHYVAAGDNLSGAVRTLDSNLYRVEEDLRDLRRDFNNGMASMSAMSALVPNPRAAGNTSLSVGTGAYNGRTAVAVGGFHHINDNIMLNAGAAWGNASDVAYRLGITWSW